MEKTPALTQYGVPEGATDNSAPIVSVTVTEDQADISRESRITWTAGATSLLVHPVTPYLVDSTLWAELRGDNLDERPAVGSTRCIRWLVPLEQNLSDYERLVREEVQGLMGRIEELILEFDRARLDYAGIRAILNPTIKSIIEDIVFNGALPSRYEETLNSIYTSMAEFHRNDFSIQKKAGEFDRELTRVQREWLVRVARSAVTTRMAGLLIHFEAKSAGGGMLHKVPAHADLLGALSGKKQNNVTHAG